jgi:hypothetical protein
MDRVGVEPTTSAHSILRQSAIDGSLFKSHPVLFLHMPCSILYRQAKVLGKKLAKPVRKRKSAWQVLVLSVWQKGHGLASKTKLNGVCVARRNFEKPADITTSLILFSPACAPSAGPSSFKDAGTQIIVDPE